MTAPTLMPLLWLLRELGFRSFRRVVFTDRTVRLDHGQFVGCAFYGCAIEYAGHSVALESCRFEGCSWQLEDGAAAAVQLLRAIATSDPEFVARTCGLAPVAAAP